MLATSLTSTVEIFSKKIKVKNYFCTSDKSLVTGETKYNLYIKITDSCNARCLFCSNKEYHSKDIFDLGKLKEVLKEFKRANILNRISITGGEPLLNVELLNKVLNLIFEVIEDAKVTLNTNGYNLEKIFELDNLSKIDGIHLSRHHYKDDVNNKIFGLDVVTKERLIEINKKLKNKHLLRLNCLLMKDHIGNIGEVNKYLELASKIGVFRVGFVSLMKVNEFCNDQFVDFNDVFKESQGTMLNTEKYYDTDICECKNGVYVAKNGEFIEYYARMTKSSKCDYCRQFVYSADNKLTTGFGRESII